MAGATPTTAMREKTLQEAVEALLRLCGWLYVHVYEMRRTNPGFPDILAIRGERCVAIELKSARGALTPAQADWLDRFRGVPGVEVYVFRPADWHDGTIERTLR